VDGFSSSDSSKSQNGRRKSFAERHARGAKKQQALATLLAGAFSFAWSLVRSHIIWLFVFAIEMTLKTLV
jgi:hypothetical protein